MSYPFQALEELGEPRPKFLDPDQVMQTGQVVNSGNWKGSDMGLFKDNKVRLCPEIEQPVRIDQDEVQCRQQHGCEQPHCPLERDFSSSSLAVLMNKLGVTGTAIR